MINGDKTQAENNRSSITESLCLPACNVRASDPRAPAVPMPSASERTRSSLFLMFDSFVMVENDFECQRLSLPRKEARSNDARGIKMVGFRKIIKKFDFHCL
jgi:hypothetical protein